MAVTLRCGCATLLTPSATISRGLLERALRGAEDRLGVGDDLLRFRRRTSFSSARHVPQDHASLCSVAPGDGSDQRRLRNYGWIGASGPADSQGRGMGIGHTVDRRLSGQPLHGNESHRGWRRFHCACHKVGASSATIAADLVAAMVYTGQLSSLPSRRARGDRCSSPGHP
jgi:hypothetical protein